MLRSESPFNDAKTSIVELTSGVVNSVFEGMVRIEEHVGRLIQASYFKTNAEMEAEFSMDTAYRQLPVNRFDNLDGYINFRFPDDFHQSYMEENY